MRLSEKKEARGGSGVCSIAEGTVGGNEYISGALGGLQFSHFWNRGCQMGLNGIYF